MSRLATPLLIGVIVLAGSVQAAELVTVSKTQEQDAVARLERLEQMAEEQTQRLEKLKAKAEDVTEGPGRVETVEVQRVVAELMSDAEFRDSLYPSALTAGFHPKRGFYIDSADQAFSLNMKGYMQVRYTAANRQTDNRNRVGRQKIDDINAFEIERLFLAFYGHVHSPKVLYRIVMDGGYTDGGANEQGGWRTYYATVDYEYVKDQYLLVGLMRLPFGGQAMTAGAVLQMMDRSMAQYFFAPDRSIGVMAHGNLFDKKMEYFAAIANGFANANDSPSNEQLDTNFAYYARMAYYLLGQGNSLVHSRIGYPESDIGYSKDPSLMFAGSFLMNDNNGDTGGGLFTNTPDSIRRGRGIGGNQVFGGPNYRGTETFTFSFDSQFKYRGFSVNAEYYLRTVDGESKYSQWELHTGRSDSTHTQGGHLQVGYFLVPKKFEVAARMGGIWDNGGDNSWEWAIGCNYFPYGSYNLRIGADFVRISEVVGGPGASPNYGFNDELSMVRVVLQAGF